LAFFAAKPVTTQLTKQWRRLEGGHCPSEPRPSGVESGRARAALACLHPVIRLFKRWRAENRRFYLFVAGFARFEE
jgi:hypothetical protein